MWLPAAATTASSLCWNDSGSSEPLTHNIATFVGENQWARTTKLCFEDHVDCGASFSERNAQIISAAQRPSS